MARAYLEWRRPSRWAAATENLATGLMLADKEIVRGSCGPIGTPSSVFPPLEASRIGRARPAVCPEMSAVGD
jgi:hypothetical protein